MSRQRRDRQAKCQRDTQRPRSGGYKKNGRRNRSSVTITAATTREDEKDKGEKETTTEIITLEKSQQRW